jgi:4-hydroxybenzoate polyprenyltransferase
LATQTLKGGAAFRAFLEMIKFEHSIFALPYAMIGMIWATPSGWPGWRTFVLIVVAMVSCRTLAMTYNRIADRDIDAKNVRTKSRAIPSGLLELRQVTLYFWISVLVFFFAAAALNTLTLILSPVAAFVTVFYSRTKRFTWLCHLWLGASLGIAPCASWIAVNGSLALVPILLFCTVMFWTAGFDIIYALQDADFDRKNGLHSIPARFGVPTALMISRSFHLLSIVFLGVAMALNQVGVFGWLGVFFAALMLGYEQSLVKPSDLSKVNLAFFTLNGFISVGVFVFVLVDHLVRRVA